MEKKKCEKEKRIAENQICSGCVTFESSGPLNTSRAEGTLDDQITRIWEENKARHIESERKILYPISDTLQGCFLLFIFSTHEIDITRIIHRNEVNYTHNRVLYTPVIAKQIHNRYKQLMKTSRQYDRLVAQWKHTHHEEDDSSPSRSWKDDNENKREKRSLRNSFSLELSYSFEIYGSYHTQSDD